MMGAALLLTSFGWHVFPCRADKRPLTSRGFKDASRDRDQIIAWWEATPGALIGLATGAVSGIAVVDLDIDAEKGIDGVSAIKSLGKLPVDTTIARTPRGGWHIYLQHHPDLPCSASKIGRGIDTRGNGGYVIAPPSPGYTWVRLPGTYKPAAPPPWLLDSLRKPTEPIVGPRPVSVASGSRYVLAALHREYDAVSRAAEGNRNHQLNRSAFSIGTLVGAGVLQEKDAIAHLTEAALVCGLDRYEIRLTIRSGLRAGMAKPRRLAA